MGNYSPLLHTHTHTYIYTHTHIHTYIHTYIHTHTHHAKSRTSSTRRSSMLAVNGRFLSMRLSLGAISSITRGFRPGVASAHRETGEGVMVRRTSYVRSRNFYRLCLAKEKRSRKKTKIKSETGKKKGNPSRLRTRKSRACSSIHLSAVENTLLNETMCNTHPADVFFKEKKKHSKKTTMRHSFPHAQWCCPR